MTRINIIPVEELTDNFLLAEYFELPRIFKIVANHWSKAREPEDLGIPDAYTLGLGHMKFFYNKLFYLTDRHTLLLLHGTKRGLDLKIDPAVGDYSLPPRHQLQWWGDYLPTEEAMQINRNRLQYRRRYDGGVYGIT